MRNHLKHVVGVLLAMLALTLLPLAGSAQAAGNDYPFRADTVQRIDPWTFTTRQCVSFAAWRLAQKGDAGLVRGWGNARDWNNRASAAGVRISSVPRVGAIAQWEPGERSDTFAAGSTRPTGWMRSGSYGHVAVVKAVHPGGVVTIEQYNMGGAGSYSTKLVKAPRYLYVGL